MVNISTPESIRGALFFLGQVMGPPSIFQRVRHTIGRALRETGQALDRLGVQGETIARSKRVNGDEPVLYDDFLSRHRHQMPLLRRGRPRISKNVAFLAPCSTLIGSVQVGAGSSIWYKAILRADNCENTESLTMMIDDEDHVQEPWELDPERESRQNSKAIGGGIFIGENTNIQDGCIIDAVKNHTRIGNGVTVGHLASIHSATVHDYCLIGMGSLLQEGVEVKSESLIGAGANVAANTVIESGELWVGSPARKIRDLTPEERQRLHYQSSEVSVRIIGRNWTRRKMDGILKKLVSSLCIQYVGVASGHRDIMNLGGNLPVSLTKYLEPGHQHEDATSEMSEQEEGTKGSKAATA